jgi:NADH pyrophosphatase NudC (nudix superfamily)
MNAITIEEAERLVKAIHKPFMSDAQIYMYGFNNAVRVWKESMRHCGVCGAEQKRTNVNCCKCNCPLE